MAGRGAAPKPDTLRQGTGRTNPNQFAELTTDGEIRGPELPTGQGYPEWHPQTLKLYESLRVSALAQTWVNTDWEFLVDTMLLHHSMWAKGSWTHAAEVRLRLGKYGTTPEDRMRLRVAVDQPDSLAQQNADVVPIQRADIRVMKSTD